MKRLFIIAFVIIWSSLAAAYDYKVECENKKDQTYLQASISGEFPYGLVAEGQFEIAGTVEQFAAKKATFFNGYSYDDNTSFSGFIIYLGTPFADKEGTIRIKTTADPRSTEARIELPGAGPVKISCD